jgi:hypothetical protein
VRERPAGGQSLADLGDDDAVPIIDELLQNPFRPGLTPMDN